MCTGLGKAIDKLPGATKQPFRNTAIGKYVPTLGGSLDPHYFRTSGPDGQANARHEALGIHKPDMPTPPTPPAPPQASKAPDATQLTKRNMMTGSGAYNMGATLLTSPGGLGIPIIGKSTLLGGG